MTQDPKSKRYKKGFAKLQEVHGKVGEEVLDDLRKTAPALADFIIEYPMAIFIRVQVSM